MSLRDFTVGIGVPYWSAILGIFVVVLVLGITVLNVPSIPKKGEIVSFYVSEYTDSGFLGADQVVTEYFMRVWYYDIVKKKRVPKDCFPGIGEFGTMYKIGDSTEIQVSILESYAH
jgi:hypothetical protein